MEGQTALTLLLVAATGVIAYLIGERRALKRAALEAKRAPVGAAPRDASAETEAPEAPPPSAPERPSAGDDEEAPPRAVGPRSRGEGPPSAPTSGLPASGPPSGSFEPKPPTIVPPHARLLQGGAGGDDAPLVKLDYEEDDTVEPTKVGALASAPPVERQVLASPVKTIDFDLPAAEPPAAAAPLFLVSATAQTDKGVRRKRNEDSLGVLESKNLFIVADGMGGYAGGAQASKMSVDTIVDAFRRGAFEGPAHGDLPAEASDLVRAIQMANANVGEEAHKSKSLAGMGTTICAAVFSPNNRRMYVGHVGDSRCYRLRKGVFNQLTADHTMAELGVKGPEGQHLSRAVGIWPTVTIDVVTAAPETGDVYLLCSDGLTKMLNDDLIANVLRNEEDPKVAVERLIFFANSRGGKDNITVVLIRVVPLDWKPKPSEPFRLASDRPPPSGADAPLSKGPPAGASSTRTRASKPVKKDDDT